MVSQGKLCPQFWLLHYCDGVVWAGGCVRGGVGCFEGVWRSSLVVMGVGVGVGGDVENTQKIQRSRINHTKYKGEPLDKKSLREVWWGWMG